MARRALAGLRARSPRASGSAPAVGWAGEGLAFLVGHPRSGTTFLGRLLGSHPDIGYWEEARVLPFAESLVSGLTRLGRHVHLDARLDTLDLDPRATTRVQRSLPDDERAAADRAAVDRVRWVLQQLRDDFRRLAGADLVLEKTPEEVEQLRLLVTLLPRARAIHIVRDPRDVVASAAMVVQHRGWPPWLPEGPDPVEAATANWIRLVGGGLDLTGRLGGRLHLVRHEDLVRRPDDEVAAVLAFLGMDRVAAIDDYLARGHGGSGLDPARSGRWERRLTPEQVRAVEERAGELMERLGYTPTPR